MFCTYISFLKNWNIFQLVRMLLEWTYKAFYNLMVQREIKHQQNKRLLEKKTRVEMIVESLKQSGATQEQIQDVSFDRLIL